MFITAIRHGEAEHNPYMRTNKRNIGENIHDPHLTNLGKSQAKNLDNKIKSIEEYIYSIYNITIEDQLIAVSPLRRALETAIIGFPNHDKEKFYINPELQEFGLVPCDTGSEISKLKEEFKELNFFNLEENWLDAKCEKNVKRIKNIKKWLKDLYYNNNCDHLIIISHEGILHSLFNSLFNNCEAKTYYMFNGDIYNIDIFL
jgi:broad specificity phosphatase PhoE